MAEQKQEETVETEEKGSVILDVAASQIIANKVTEITQQLHVLRKQYEQHQTALKEIEATIVAKAGALKELRDLFVAPNTEATKED